MQRIEQWPASRLALLAALLGRLADDRGLDGVEGLDLPQALFGDRDFVASNTSNSRRRA